MSDHRPCPLCGRGVHKSHVRDAQYVVNFDCSYCGHFAIAPTLEHQQRYNKDYHGSSHLLRGFIQQWNERNHGESPVFDSGNALDAALAKCPRNVVGKRKRLLENLVQRQNHFGEQMRLSWDQLSALSFAENDVEGRAILACLREEGLVRELTSTNASTTVEVTGRGIQEYESGKLSLPATIFISSTCYDLLDLRCELAQMLESRGSVVKLSEDPQRFAVDPTVDSIQTCVANLESSDVLVCVIDRRYGGILGGDYGDVSATHLEIAHAQRMTPSKPIFFFMRERAWLDYGLLKGNPTIETQWVEPKNPAAKAKWLAFVREIAAIPSHANRSNWVTLFRTSCDLRHLVLKRLNEWNYA